MMAPPTMLAAQGVGPEVLGQAASRLGEVGEAAWRELKGLPVIGDVARFAGGAAGTGLQALQIPGRIVEESLGKLTQGVSGEHGAIPLAPSQHMTEEQKAQSAAIAESAGLGWHPGARYAISQGVLAASRLGAASINEYAVTRYGNTAETQAAVQRARLLGYSSYEAQREGVDRLMAGEDLETVINGRPVMLYPPQLPADQDRWVEDKAAVGAYLTGVTAQGGDATSAAEEIQRTGRIPQSADMWNELLGQYGLDPINLIQGLEALDKADALRAAAAAKYGGDSAEVKAIVAAADTASDDLARTAQQVDDYVAQADVHPALRPILEGEVEPDYAYWTAKHAREVEASARDRAARAVYATLQADEAPRGNTILDRVRNWIDVKSPIARTPRAVAQTAANNTVQIFGTLLEGVETPGEAMEITHRFLVDPGTLVPRFGGLVVSDEADGVRQLLARVVNALDDPDMFPDEVFSRNEYLMELGNQAMYQSLRAQGVSAREVSLYERMVGKVKGLMSNLYLTSPGYAARNWQSDVVTAAWDGSLSTASRGAVDDLITNLGVATWRLGGEAAGQMALTEGLEEGGNWLTRGWGKWADLIGSGEESRYRRVFYTGFENALDWAPKVPDEVATLLDPEAVRALEVGLAQGRSLDEFAALGTHLPPDAALAVNTWVDSDDFVRQWSTARSVAVESGRAAADFALLDYTAAQTKLDVFLKNITPFSYWLTHNTANWIKRFAERPGALTAYIRLQETLERYNQERGLPAKYAGTFEIPGTGVMVDPLKTTIPFAGIFFRRQYEREAKNLVDEAFQALEAVGIRPYPFVDIPLRLKGVVGEPEEIGRVIPQTGALLAITAILGIGGPQGIDLEGPLRMVAGLPATEAFQSNRVDSMLAAGAALNPTKVQSTLIAQELNRQAHEGVFTLNAAMGVSGSEDKVDALAREQGWSRSQLMAAQEVLRDGVRLAQINRGIQTLASFGVGVSLSVLSAGEREQLALAQEKRATMYSPLTEQGSRGALQALQLTHPEMGPYGVKGSTLPGASPEDRTPAEQWQWNEYSRRGDEIRRGIQTRTDAIRRETPWDNEAIQALYDQQNAELVALRAELHIPETTGEVFLSSVYGASPEEVQAIRRRDVLTAIGAGKPNAGDFLGEDGAPDWARYYEAVDGFWANLPASMREDPKVIAAAQDLSERTGQVVTPDSLLAGLDLAAYEAHQRRYDSPTEAALAVWDTKVSGPAWAAYRAAEDRGEKGAYERYIAPIQEMPAVDLIGQIQGLYPGRWTDMELKAALRGMDIPAIETMSLMKKSPEEQGLSQASGAFWDYYNDQVPPGSLGKSAREALLVSAIVGAEDKSAVTEAEYTAALEWLQEWREQNEKPYWGDSEDWVEARAQNQQFENSAAEAIPGIRDILDGYYATASSSAERKAYKREHPEVQQYFDMRDEFGADKAHEIWAYYYQGKTYGEKSSLGTYYTGSGSKRYYYRKGKSRGGRSYGPNFAYQAKKTPKVFLDTPLAWKSTMPKLEYRYRPTPQWKLGSKALGL